MAGVLQVTSFEQTIKNPVKSYSWWQLKMLPFVHIHEYGSFYLKVTVSPQLGPTEERLIKSLLELSIEGWRFSRTFARVISKLDAGEGSRYENQYRYYLKRISENLEEAGLRLVNVEGLAYDTGFAVSALNIGDFDPDDNLYVDQMIEPIIMGAEGVVRPGTVMLRKA